MTGRYGKVSQQDSINLHGARTRQEGDGVTPPLRTRSRSGRNWMRIARCPVR